MRVIIIGGGEVGYALSRSLAPDHSITIVDHNPDVRERFEALDVAFLSGSATSGEVLRRAQAEQADMLIACTGLDEVNLVACAIARGQGLARTICFVSKDDFLRENGGGATSVSVSRRSSTPTRTLTSGSSSGIGAAARCSPRPSGACSCSTATGPTWSCSRRRRSAAATCSCR